MCNKTSKTLDLMQDFKVPNLSLGSSLICKCSSHSNRICKLKPRVSAQELPLQFKTHLKDNSCLNNKAFKHKCKLNNNQDLVSLKTSINLLKALTNQHLALAWLRAFNLTSVLNLPKDLVNSQPQTSTNLVKGFNPSLKVVLVEFNPLNPRVEILEVSSPPQTIKKFTLVAQLTWEIYKPKKKTIHSVWVVALHVSHF